MSNELTTIRCVLNKRSWDALNRVRAETGLNATDTVNRALQIYALMLDVEPGAKIIFDNPGWPDKFFVAVDS
jgi:hypothetical protein